ncbi:MAG: hypothetical protein L0Y55_11045 [Anaerolineales bacterium]|nr:hypothetical protein [Anaerolineales bacterium]
MSRDFFILILLGVLTYVVIWLSSELTFEVDWSSYFVGLFIAATTAWIYFTVIGWRRTADRPEQKQIVEIQTKETPKQITNAAFLANLKTVALLIVGLCAIFILVGFLEGGFVGLAICAFIIVVLLKI